MNDDFTPENQETVQPPEEVTTIPPEPVEGADRRFRIPVLQQLGVALGILLLIFGSTYADKFHALFAEEEQHARAAIEDVATEILHEAVPTDYFVDMAIAAESAFVWDVTKQRALYNKNADLQLPLASVTKLMTALVAYELLDANERVDISSEAILEEGESGFSSGEVFSFENLLDLTLISSSNDGAYALAAAAGNALTSEQSPAAIFVEAMNIRAEEIGLTQTYFNNATGLDVSQTTAGGYGSARDMTFLMEFILSRYPGLLERTTTDFTVIANEDGAGHQVENTNQAIHEIDGIIASKTGYTDLAGGNLIVAFDAGLNRPIIITVLGSTRTERFSDVVTLAERVRQHIIDHE